ncbi:nitrous oxide reductase accessory protein NosL [Paenibacillus sp. D2_2]|uniref:nitrous oxide reductase accessory protein NosL n=1 Tax=Paenibacillus sp. D2_2 TaxID=3073092 RepID=UPI00281646F6|nr:nitrous oxide reductase accessory protein NosL [Paenibacillus sp. D2_2]WMT43110.1 nitrous oxide reductase accessory protein NosL [Paenibacillus sp. D2_2]
MKKGLAVLMIMFVFAALIGCGQKKYEAQAINEDVDVCAVCNMQVKDGAYATQIITKDGRSIKFDDIGCMNKWKSENGTDQIGMDYVRDYNDKSWVEYEKAAYVYDPSIRTPMAYGIVSFKDKKTAEAFIKEQGVGTLLSADDLTKHTWQQSMDMMDMNDHEHIEEDNGAHGEMNMNSNSGH